MIRNLILIIVIFIISSCSNNKTITNPITGEKPTPGLFSKDSRKGISLSDILSQKDYPEFSMYRENIITLTPNQHFLESHPNNNTQVTDLDYQKKCLLYKLKSISNSYEIVDYFYDINSFIMIVNTLYEDVLIEPIKFNEDFSTIEKIIQSIDIVE